MKILFVNKFLYPNGGSETYIFQLANYLKQKGHQVEFFGMEDEKNIVGQDISHVSNINFHEKSLKKVVYPLKIIYSNEARKKIRQVLKNFKPDVVHLNNYNFQLTPSIIYEIKKHNISIVQTVHDYQLVCPNHMMYIVEENEICERCISNGYKSCVKNRCIHNSTLRSLIGTVEAKLYSLLNTYSHIDKFICPSKFLAGKLIEGNYDKSKIDVLYNFINNYKKNKYNKSDYILYFGRLSNEKGIDTLINVCKELPDIDFIFAGTGPLTDRLEGINNINYVGFQIGEDLNKLIGKSLFSIYPSEWYENCPLSVLESQALGTPVIGANIGGIPELVENKRDGLLFESGNENDLKEKILYLYNNKNILEEYSTKCQQKVKKFSLDQYYEKIMNIYKDVIRGN